MAAYKASAEIAAMAVQESDEPIRAVIVRTTQPVVAKGLSVERAFKEPTDEIALWLALQRKFVSSNESFIVHQSRRRGIDFTACTTNCIEKIFCKRPTTNVVPIEVRPGSMG